MWLQEYCRQVKAEVVRYSRNKLNQTTFIWTYVYLVQHFDAPHSREVMAVTALIPPSSSLNEVPLLGFQQISSSLR